MKRDVGWILAGFLVTAGGLLVAGCPDETTASEAVSPAAAKVRDYLFPPSATSKYGYETTTTRWEPNEDQPRVSTSSFQYTAARLTATEAVLAYPIVQGVDATLSYLAETDGTVAMSLEFPGGPPQVLMRFPDAALTKAGATVFPASGSLPPLRVARIAKETVTVPAGTFETIKVKLQVENDKGTPIYYWLAKGMGQDGVKRTHTSTRSIDDSASVSTTSTVVVLKSFTP